MEPLFDWTPALKTEVRLLASLEIFFMVSLASPVVSLNPFGWVFLTSVLKWVLLKCGS